MPVLAGIDFGNQSEFVAEAILAAPREYLIVGEDYVTRSDLSWDYIFTNAKGDRAFEGWRSYSSKNGTTTPDFRIGNRVGNVIMGDAPDCLWGLTKI